MRTPANEYEKILYLIQDKNPQKIILDVPKDENPMTGASTFYINLNTRMIETPEYLSVQYDHNAENIYFVVDRFYDNFDLANTCCVIQYENANPDPTKKGYLYVPPFYDLISFGNEKMAFQWSIQGPATQFSGDIKFAIKFYQLESHTAKDENGFEQTYYAYRYNLNTLPAKSKILYGMDVQIESENYLLPASEIDVIFERLSALENRIGSDIYWLKME